MTDEATTRSPYVTELWLECQRVHALGAELQHVIERSCEGFLASQGIYLSQGAATGFGIVLLKIAALTLVDRIPNPRKYMHFLVDETFDRLQEDGLVDEKVDERAQGG